MRFSLRHLMLAVTIAACAAWSIKLGISRTRHNIEANRSTYAARLVAQMCVEHLKANNAWPTGWDELRDDYGPCVAQSGQAWSFDELKERVGVDWSINPNYLPPGPILWVANDPTFPFFGTTPDEIVTQYVESAARARTAPSN